MLTPPTLVLSTPATVQAEFLVLAPERIPPKVDELAAAPISDGALPLWCPRVRVYREEIPPIAQLAHIRVCPQCTDDAALQQRIVTSDSYFTASCVGTAAWPPTHLWQAMTTAFAYARAARGVALDVATDSIVVDGKADAPLQKRYWNGSYPTGFTFPTADWVTTNARSRHDKHWSVVTAGLIRFGLPELSTHYVAPELVATWALILLGAAHMLLKDHWVALARDPDQAFRETPAIKILDTADVDGAMGRPFYQLAGQTPLGLRWDPSPEAKRTFLQVLPPLQVDTPPSIDHPAQDYTWKAAVAAQLDLRSYD